LHGFHATPYRGFGVWGSPVIAVQDVVGIRRSGKKRLAQHLLLVGFQIS